MKVTARLLQTISVINFIDECRGWRSTARTCAEHRAAKAPVPRAAAVRGMMNTTSTPLVER